ncbi:MAG: NUDIX domain-containing protein [Rhodothermales bacterium]
MSPYYQQIRVRIGHQLMMVPSVAAVIRDEEGRLLLQHKASGEGWSLPAGAIEPGERPEDALRREVREETGLIVTARAILGVFGGAAFRYVYPNGDAVEYTVVLYRCDITGGHLAACDAETGSLRFHSRAGMPLLALPYPTELLFPASDMDMPADRAG